MAFVKDIPLWRRTTLEEDRNAKSASSLSFCPLFRVNFPVIITPLAIFSNGSTYEWRQLIDRHLPNSLYLSNVRQFMINSNLVECRRREFINALVASQSQFMMVYVKSVLATYLIPRVSILAALPVRLEKNVACAACREQKKRLQRK